MHRPHPSGLVPPAPLLRDAEQAIVGHQARHTVQAGSLAFITQRLVHARRAHCALAVGVALTDLFQQAGIVLRTCTGRTTCPCMEAATRDLQAPAHQLNRVLAAVASDRLVPQDDSLAKNAAASRKIPASSPAPVPFSAPAVLDRELRRCRKALSPALFISRRQRNTWFALTPMSRQYG
jgi:hypothetical protein